MVARSDDGVRVAVTGAGPFAFRHAGLEAALDRRFDPDAIDAVEIDASELMSDMHAAADYRAELVRILTARAVRRLQAGA